MELKGVSKYFTDRRGRIITAVDNVSFSIGKGEILGLVGESGSGKTTIGRMTVGLTRASKGEVLLDGTDIAEVKNMKKVWTKAQFIHQDPYSSLDPYMTVKEVLERPLSYLMNIAKQEQGERLDEVLRVIGLRNSYLPKRLQELSGGERQRVLIARAFMPGPVYVVADEPTSMIDFIHRNSVIVLLRKLRSEFSTSFLLITHDLSVAADLCDTIGIMHNAHVIEYGPKDQVLTNPKESYTKELLAATPDNMIAASDGHQEKA
ncbi:MAG: ATP-binding cassette domain-containing protein [Thaumarchaeota archaeon]|nr:ATP-binding cassette domain-containing protein [Nitrososphaerota archaeon]